MTVGIFHLLYRGFDTPILNRLIFKKIANAFGGNMKTLISGGAPLPHHVKEFLRVCLSPNTMIVRFLVDYTFRHFYIPMNLVFY